MPSNHALPSLRILLPLPEYKSGETTLVNREVHRRWEVTTRLKHIAAPRREALAAFRQAMLHPATALKVLGPMGADVQGSRAVNLGFDRTPRVSPFLRTDPLMRSAMSFDTLGAAAYADLEGSVLFVCPLLGVVTPKERIPDYRCPIAADLPGIGSLHFHWRGPVSTTLDRLTRGIPVVSFLPRRLAALWVTAPSTQMTIRFSRRTRAGLVGESAAAPRLTGECLRWMANGRVGDLSHLQKFVSTSGHRHANSAGGPSAGDAVLHFVR